MSEMYGIRWMSDDETNRCLNPKCNDPEFRTFHRKHHCRFCGRIFCSACVNFKAFHPKSHQDENICVLCIQSPVVTPSSTELSVDVAVKGSDKEMLAAKSVAPAKPAGSHLAAAVDSTARKVQ